VLVASVGLLALVAVAADGSPLDAPPDSATTNQRLVGIITLGALAAGALAIVILVIALAGERVTQPRFAKRSSFVRNLVLVAACVLVAIGLLTLRRRDKAPEPQQSQPASIALASGTTDSQSGPPWPVLILGVVVVGALGWAAWSARRRGPGSPPPPDEPADPAGQRAAAGAAFAASLGDLEGEPDPRRAIIVAYARLLDGLAACGLPRQPAEAPEEHLRRALEALRVLPDALRTLVALFAEARFSTHELTAVHKTLAIDAFRAARDDLAPHVVPA
jgi:hypothetical protein